jgi:hypothetical protein
MLNLPFTLLAGAAVTVALVNPAPDARHEMTLNSPAPAVAPAAPADRSPSIGGCPRPAAASPATRRSWCPGVP